MVDVFLIFTVKNIIIIHSLSFHLSYSKSCAFIYFVVELLFSTAYTALIGSGCNLK